MSAERDAAPRSRWGRWAADRPDDAVLRWLFAAALTATLGVLALDFLELQGVSPGEPWTAPSVRVPGTLRPEPREGDERRFGPSAEARGARMAFDLLDNGRLVAKGTIEPGTAEAFAAEIAKRGSYVRTVVLESPGGSVSDALKMGRLIRQKGFATEVEGGRTCASSCPLVFAGGAERRAGPKAAIGVHQVSAWTEKGTVWPGGGMESAQRVSAECQRYLREMGIDLEVWLRAMETPREKLYFFKPEELLSLKLATQNTGAKPALPDGRARS